MEITTWHHLRPESKVCCILQCFFKLFMIPRCDFRAQRVPQSIKMLTPLNGFCLFWHLENWQKRVQNVHKMWNGTTVLWFCLLFWALKIRKHTFADRRNVFFNKICRIVDCYTVFNLKTWFGPTVLHFSTIFNTLGAPNGSKTSRKTKHLGIQYNTFTLKHLNCTTVQCFLLLLRLLWSRDHHFIKNTQVF